MSAVLAMAPLDRLAGPEDLPDADFDAADDEPVPQTGEPVHALSPAPTDEARLAAWVRAVADQHQPSFAGLYAATAGRVYGLALRIVRQQALAEEVVEDVFWQVWREAPRFDAERGRVLAWLLAIARSRAIDALRRRERLRGHEVSVDDAIDDAASEGGDNDPQDLLAASQHHRQLHAVLASLDPLPRQLLTLAFFRGCTHDEIAAQTGLALGTVKSLIRRTLAALRAQLAASIVSQ